LENGVDIKTKIETKEIKRIEIIIKSIGDDGVFQGYASFFGNVDSYGDIVKKGAFKKTLKESKGKVPILHNHDPRYQIGWNEEAYEDDKGLFVSGRLDLNVQLAKEQHSLMKMALKLKARTGLSIGYRTIKWENDRDDPAIRVLTELQLAEYSVVAFPANTLATIIDVKSQINNLTIYLQTEFGLNEPEAVKAVETITPLLEIEPGNDAHSQRKEAGTEELEPLTHSLKKLLSTIKN
jgi:uncharacterized protein